MRRLTALLVAAIVLLTGPADVTAEQPDAGFVDVSADSVFAAPISWLRLTGITRGCNPPSNTSFCPTEPVSRGQMAAFLSRALHLEPSDDTDRFTDAAGSVFEADINRISAAGITSGCNPPTNDQFCPNGLVTREQMAAFLARALDLEVAGSNPGFTDIDGSIFADDINRMAAAGITRGCNPPTNDHYCPTALVTREQFAAFMWRANGEPAPPVAARIVAAGDIARCELTSDEETALLLDELFADTNGIVAALGDTVYNDGSPEQFRDCYEPSWGRHRFRTRPAVGNHEYRTKDASGYYSYFGEAAGDSATGWYSYSMNDWQVLVLNSNCDEVGGCDAGSDQEQWLRDQLVSSPARCTLAYMHHPRFSSGLHGDDDRLADLWRLLEEHGVEMVLAGHDHNYERFSPLTADGELAQADGVQSFVVGTGGTYLRPMETIRAGSAIAIDDRHGVLALDLFNDSYDWRFIDTAGSILDSGSRSCT